MDDDHLSQFGEYIHHVRELHGLTLRQLAGDAGIDPGGLTRLEHGHAGAPKPATLHALARALDLSLADLFAMVGYTVPRDLPSIKPYLRAKYAELPEEIVDYLGTEIEYLANPSD